MTTNQSKTRRTLRGLLCVSLLWPLGAFAVNTDNFNDNSKDPANWGADVVTGSGVLTEVNQRLEYTCSLGIETDANRPWVLTRMPYTTDWHVQIDTANNTAPAAAFQVNSFGLLILSPLTATNSLNVELYSSAYAGPPKANGFNANLDSGGSTLATADTGDLGVTNGAVRMVFTSATKVITVFYDLDVSDGYQWVQFGSFGLAGAGGIDGNTNWSLADTNQFPVYVYGYAAAMAVTSGQLFGDNFQETGGVTPSGGPSPKPIGSFHFAFPTNNPLLTAILNITGNYRGMLPTLSQRNYNIDVAQDESGKVSAMGTIEGILNENDSPEISGATGAIKTVNEKPTAQLKGKFSGTRDGLTATMSGAADGPVELIDVGGGTNGVAGTFSFKSKVAGVPFRVNKVALQVAAPPGAVDNLKKQWILDLDINQKTVNGKERTVASAELLLPNGDTIKYPERTVKYSASKGYKLSFKKGMNITVNPPRTDKKSAIMIKGMTIVQQGATLQPSGGTIKYQFLGQKGTTNLLDFVGP